MKRMFSCFCFAVLFFSITAASAMADINDDLYSAVDCTPEVGQNMLE